MKLNKKTLMDQMMQRSIALWSQQILRGPNKEPFNGRFLINDHHIEWSEILAKNRMSTILSPRFSGKTHFFNMAYPLHRVFYNPGIEIMILSASDKQVVKIMRTIRKEVEDNPKLSHLVPTRKDNWAKMSLQFANGAFISGHSFWSEMRGYHPDIIILDDILKERDGYSAEMREKTKEMWQGSLSKMIDADRGEVRFIGTPFSKNDLLHLFKNDPSWVWKRYQAIFNDENGEERALWPKLFSLSTMQRLRDSEPAILFSREYLCEPISDMMSLFPSTLFNRVGNYTFGDVEFARREALDVYLGVDLAFSAEIGADYTAIFVIGIDEVGHRYVLDLYRAKGMKYSAQTQLIQEVAEKWDAVLITVETVAAQSIIAQILEEETELNILRCNTTKAAKNSLRRGLPGIRRRMEKHEYTIPRDTSPQYWKALGNQLSPLETWKEELAGFIYADGVLTSTADHDDTAMANFLCEFGITSGAGEFTTTYGDEPLDSTHPMSGEELLARYRSM